MLIVVTPATSSALTTGARAAAILGVANDAALAMAIDAASSMIADHCRRPFAIETLREVFRLPRSGHLLARAPAIDVLSVLEVGISLTPHEYELDGEQLFRVSYGCRLPWAGPMTAEYKAGYSLPSDSGTWTLPATVERAAVLVASSILSSRERDPMMRSESVDGVGSTSWWVPAGGSLPSAEAETLLAPYRRIVG